MDHALLLSAHQYDASYMDYALSLSAAVSDASSYIHYDLIMICHCQLIRGQST